MCCFRMKCTSQLEKVLSVSVLHMGLVPQQNLSSVCPTQQDSTSSPQLQRLARKLKISLVVSLDLIISKKQITKVLIRLC